MSVLITVAAISTGLLALAIWVEIRERRGAVGDGDYKSSQNLNS